MYFSTPPTACDRKITTHYRLPNQGRQLRSLQLVQVGKTSMFRCRRVFVLALLILVACGKKEGTQTTDEGHTNTEAARPPAQAVPAGISSADEPPAPSNS